MSWETSIATETGTGEQELGTEEELEALEEAQELRANE